VQEVLLNYAWFSGCVLGFLRGLQKGFQRLPILGEHAAEPDPVSHLWIARHDGGGDQDGGPDGKLQIQIGPNWKWINRFDVTAA
jgi:hypothetical protein